MEAMISFVAAYRDKHGVEPICRVLEIAPSNYHEHVRRRAKPETAPPRVQRDAKLMVEIRRVFEENFQSTARARSGVSSCEKVTMWRAARSND